MKKYIFALSLLASCATQAMEEKQEAPMIVKASVGAIVSLPVYDRDKLSNAFYRIVRAPKEDILQFVEDGEIKNSENTESLTTVVAKFRTLKPGITAIRFGVYAQSMCKTVGFCSYTVEVK